MVQDNINTKEFRLHVSGLAPSVVGADVASRFDSFGTVVGDVNGLGKDANGFPKTYAFLTLETTEGKIAKCTSMLSGSMWKGHKLRVALAKPDYRVRLEAERLAAEALLNADPDSLTARKMKKSKRNPDPAVGTPARYFETVTVDNIKRHKGWTIDPTPVPTPLFPLLTRPSHPLPLPPARATATSWTREAPKAKAKASRAARLALRDGTARTLTEPLTRARKVRIDPRRWGRKKFIFGEEGNGDIRDDVRGAWECVEPEGDESEKTVGKEDEVKWVFRAKDGIVRRTEVIRLTQRSIPHTDNFASLLEGLVSTAPPPSTTLSSPRQRQNSLSPPPYIPSAPRTLLYNEEDSFALLFETQAGDEVKESRKKEREKQLQVLKSLLGVDGFAENQEGPKESKSLPAVEGFGDDDDDDDGDDDDDDDGDDEEEGEEMVAAMRLRGGAGSDEDSSSDEEEDVEMEEDKSIPTAHPAGPASTAKTTLQMGSLKDMFKPQEEASTSFSLFSGLDLDLEPVERTPSPPPTRPPPPVAPSEAFVAPPALGRSNRTWVGTGPSTSFFPFPSGKFEGQDGDVIVAEASKLGFGAEKSEEKKRESDRILQGAAQAFWKDDPIEQIEAKHQKLREALRGQARKRHREASKRSRKIGKGKRTRGDDL